MIYKSESGRSMLELLAVLAVIGVLSVGGVEGYTYAMDKNEANNIAEEVSILAHEVSQQMNRGQAEGSFTDQVKSIDLPQDVQIKLKKYNSNTKKYEEGEPGSDDDQFALEVSGLKPKVGKIFLSSVLGAEPGLQKIQQNEGGEIQDLTNLGDWSSSSTSTTTKLALVYQKDLEDTCPAGEYKVDGLCQLATGRDITSVDGVLEECPNATEPNSGHTECVACLAGEQCGCAKMSDGNGNCVDCVKNTTCGTDKMCYLGQCYACPTNGDCTIEKGFKCKENYTKHDEVFCCPDNATCTTGNGALKVTCKEGYEDDGNETCVPIIPSNCPTGSTYDGNATDPSKALETGHCTCNLADNSQCGGSNSSYYCAFARSNLSCIADSSNELQPSTGSGTCESITTYRSDNISGIDTKNGHLYNEEPMDWWSANAWCVAKGSTGLLKVAGCGDETGIKCTWSDVSTEVFGMSKWYWLKNLTGSNSCSAVYVNVGSRNVYYPYPRYNHNPALCE